MNKHLFLITILALAIFATGVINNRSSRIQESITYFPIDPKVNFTTTNTSISILKHNKADKYLIDWHLDSTLGQKAYLRQDIGFLFSNGRLIAKQGNWKQHTAELHQERQIAGRDRALIQALTFHHAELHESQDQIFSSQGMSADQMYVTRLQNGTFHSFRNVFSKQDQETKDMLDQKTKESLRLSWEKGMRYFSINPERYYALPLTDLFLNKSTELPGFTGQESNRIIGNLWEGLYKNYFLGIKKADGTKISPIGSTIPLLLIAKDRSHLIVLTETFNGEPTLLRQTIEYEH